MAICKLFEIVTKSWWYGTTLFWVETYYKNKANYLQHNMWLGIRHNAVYVIEVETLRKLKEYKLDDWQFFHLPNALMIGKTYESAIWFTTAASFSIHALIQKYKNDELNSICVKEVDRQFDPETGTETVTCTD